MEDQMNEKQGAAMDVEAASSSKEFAKEASKLTCKTTAAIGIVDDPLRTSSLCTGSQEETNEAIVHSDPELVDWDGDNDPANPQNWRRLHKWAMTLVLAVFMLVASMSASMIAPCLDDIAADLHIRDAFLSQMVMSAYVLSWGLGPLLLGPLSEVYGRAVVLQVSNIFYLVFNLACGFSQSAAQLVVFRILSGLGSSAPLGLCEGVLGDIWPREELGRAIAIESTISLLGPALGPIMGGLVSANTSWRWVFHVTTIATGLVAIGGALSLRETYAPFLLRAKARRRREETKNGSLRARDELPTGGLLRMILLNLSRPIHLLATQCIIQFIAVFSAIAYGIGYILLTSYSTIMMTVYREDSAISSLHYIALGIGFWGGCQVGAPLIDRIYVVLKKRNNGVAVAEHHLPLMGPACILTCIGFFWFGWSLEARTFWLMPDIGAALICAGTLLSCLICVQTYIIHAYPTYAASAMSVFALARSLAGFSFPLFSPYLFSSIGYGWGSSVLALLILLVGVPMSAILWRFGHILRAKSPLAQG